MAIEEAENYDRESYILVVDDDNTLLKFFKIHLNKFFSKVIVVKSAREAVDTLREKEIDLIISDLRMPRMSGLQLLKKANRLNPSIPVLIISGALLTEEQEDGCMNDADGFLRKPFTVDELHSFIDEGIMKRKILKEIHETIPKRIKLRNLVNNVDEIEKLKGPKKEKVVKLLEELADLNLSDEKAS